MNENIKAITDFLNARMDGEPAPAANSTELQALSRAIAELQKHDSRQELQALALVIDRARASLQSEAVLEKFIRGESSY